jgi:hypothetical protein
MGIGGVKKKLFDCPTFDNFDAIFGYAKPTISLSDWYLSWKSKRCLFHWYRLASDDCQ